MSLTNVQYDCFVFDDSSVLCSFYLDFSGNIHYFMQIVSLCLDKKKAAGGRASVFCNIADHIEHIDM